MPARSSATSSSARKIVDLGQDEVEGRRAQQRRHHHLLTIEDGSHVWRAVMTAGRRAKGGADPQHQVVLGLARGEEVARRGEEVGDAGVSVQAHRLLRVRCAHDEDRLRLHARAVPSDRPARLGGAGGSGGLQRRLPGQRALPPVDPAAGAGGLRLELHGRPGATHLAPLRHRRDLPGLPLPPRGDRPRGGHAGRHVPRAECGWALAPGRR